MKSLVLAAVAALSLPAAALARGEADRQVRPPAYATIPVHAPVQVERREVAELRGLVARLDAAAPGRRDRREVAFVEAELLRACEREIAEARIARPTGWQEVPGSRRYAGAAFSQPSGARLDALLAVRAGLQSVRGRTDWASLRQARALGHELTRLAALDARYEAPLPTPPAWNHDRDDDRGYEHRRG